MSWKAGSGIKFMSDQIIGMRQWFETPPGRYLLAWERAEFDRAVSDIFGFHALQLGLPELDALQANRMPHRWLAVEAPPKLTDGAAEGSPPAAALGEIPAPPAAAAHAAITLHCHFDALPFDAASLDLVVL